MTCQRFDLPGGFAIVCSRGPRSQPAPCTECKARPHAVLCDFPLRGAKAGKTCSCRLCTGCAVHIGSCDLCPAHAKVTPPQPARGRTFDHLEPGSPDDRLLSRAARAMATSAWWVCVPEWEAPAAVAGEVGR